MSIPELLILAVSLSADAFAVSVCKGLAMGKIKFSRALIVGLWFGTFQALMPTVGYFLGSAVGGVIGRFDFIVAFVILAAIGTKMIVDAIRGSGEKTNGTLDVKEMLLLAVATSIDAFAAGVSMALVEVNIALSAAVIGVTTLILSAAGVYIGGLFGGKFEKPARIVGGAALVILSQSRALNALALGPDLAQTLGVRTGRVLPLVLGAASLAVAAAVSLAGIIGFVGLVVPHAVRRIAGANHRALLPASAVAGGLFLVACDQLGKLFGEVEIPAGVVTALAGGPFFLWLLARRGRHA